MEKLLNLFGATDIDDLTKKVKETGVRRFTISCVLEFGDIKQNIATTPRTTLKEATEL